MSGDFRYDAVVIGGGGGYDATGAGGGGRYGTADVEGVGVVLWPLLIIQERIKSTQFFGQFPRFRWITYDKSSIFFIAFCLKTVSVIFHEIWQFFPETHKIPSHPF